MSDQDFDRLCEYHGFRAVARGEFPTVPRAMLRALVGAAVAAEREACAKQCELESVVLSTRDMTRGALYCADKIRARATMETHASST